MLHKTKGIFLHQVKYSETSFIAKIYTREFGLKSFIVKGSRSKKSNIRANVFQPCNHFNMVVSLKEKQSLHYIKEIGLIPTPGYASINLAKTSILMFLAEIILKTIREEEANTALYDFLEEAINQLGKRKSGLGIFHLVVMIKLSGYLGYSINENLKTNSHEEESAGISIQAKNFILNYCNLPLDYNWQTNFDQAFKKEILDTLIKYYELHLLKYGDIKSHQILEAVL